MTGAHLYTAPKGLKGFDCNFVLSDQAIGYFRDVQDCEYVFRYLRREDFHPYDLSAGEAARIINGDLGLAAVQHVAPKGWMPSASKGIRYGSTAKQEALKIGLPEGTMLVLDLEGVDHSATEQLIIDYCNSWHSVVAGGGFLPCLYVGWDCGLSPDVLYYKLRFTHYWGAFNAQVSPTRRGFQLQQGEEIDTPYGKIDPDTVTIDRLGGAPVFLAREGWLDG